MIVAGDGGRRTATRDGKTGGGATLISV